MFNHSLITKLINKKLYKYSTLLFLCFTATNVAKAASDTTPEKPEDPKSWRSNEYFASGGLAALNADQAYAAGLTGKGVNIGILDTLVFAKHPVFGEGKVTNLHTSGIRTITNIVEAHKKKGDAFYYDENFAPGILHEHGTFVGSIAAAPRNGKEMHGIAFNAHIVAAQIDDSMETGNILFNDGGVFGAAWKAMIASGVRVINSSWGIGPIMPRDAEDIDFSKPIFTLTQARTQYEGITRILGTPEDGAYQGAMDAARSGILNVFAAGNSGKLNEPDAMTGLPYFVPDLVKNWLTVASVDVKGDNAYQLSSFSTRCAYAASFCVTAPGHEIYSAVVEYKNTSDMDFNNLNLHPEPALNYTKGSGTSAAAPFVSGSAALLMERFPYMASDQIATVLKTTATDLGKPGIDEEFGWGLINLGKAINGPAMFITNADIPEEFHLSTDSGVMNYYDDMFVANLPGVNEVIDKGKLTERVCDAASCGLDIWSNDISGHGGLMKTGQGTLILAGNNTYSGETNVMQGILVVAGEVTSDVTVSHGATLSGNGTVGTLTAANGAFIAPGHAGDTLTATDHINLNHMARYQVEVDAPGNSTLLYTPGKAFIDKSLADISVVKNNLLASGHVDSITAQNYTILTADNGVEGQFTLLDSPLFLRSNLSYQPTNVTLNFERNDLSLAHIAQTQNGRAVATAIDALPTGHPVLESILTLSSKADARRAFRQLTGQIHADIAAALVNDSRYLRETLNSRLRQAEGQTAADSDSSVWVQMLGEKNHASGNDNATGYQTSTYGVLIGLDGALSDSTQVGVATGYTRTSLKGGYGSSADSNNTHLALYASKQWDNLALRTGGIYSWHSIDTERSVNYDVQSDSTAAGYNGRTGQIFTELGYGIQV